MIRIIDKFRCCGCTACYAICTHDAISMVPDTLGFLYPKVNEANCVDCGLCEKVCPFLSDYKAYSNLIKPVAFAARHKNVKEIEKSRSGAVFVALTDEFLSMGINNAVVYGAGYKQQFQVCHKRATTKEERDEFRGSKYTQSNLDLIFRQVRTDLQNGHQVLFSGTPCQTAGLSAFIGRHLRKNLFLVDLVCHGVASPFVWRDYIKYLEEKEKDTIVSVNFRNKEIFGWSGLHKESFLFRKKGVKVYDYVFYQPYMLRHSCNVCPFTNLLRPSDVTIADFWGWEEVLDHSFNVDDKGCSLVICNTVKGLEFFQSVREQMNICSVPLDKCLQPNLQYPTPIHPQRETFEADYKQWGFCYVRKKYGDIGLKFQMKRVVRFIKRILNEIRK